MRGWKARQRGQSVRADSRVLVSPLAYPADRPVGAVWLYAWRNLVAPAVRTGRTLTPAPVTSRAGPIGPSGRLASAVHLGDVLAAAAACGEQVVDRGHRFE